MGLDPSERILVATNGSATARAAVIDAAELAGRDGASLDVVAVAPTREASSHVAALLEAARLARGVGVEPALHAAAGDPVAAILSTARRLRPRLLVVGSGTRASVRTARRPSVVCELARRAACPLLIVGPRALPSHARCSTSTPS